MIVLFWLGAAAKRAAIAARGGLFRTSSSRSGLGFGGAGWARSHYEEAQMLQRLQALERMRTMCQVRDLGLWLISGFVGFTECRSPWLPETRQYLHGVC